MTTVLPFTAPDHPALSALVAREWEDSPRGPGIARLAGVDPRWVEVEVLPMGLVRAFRRCTSATEKERAQWNAAVARLAEVIEDHGYAVDWTGAGPRVVGWAAVEEWRRLDPPRPWPGKTVLVRIIDLPPSDPRAQAHADALHAARLARHHPVVGPGAESRGEMAARREAGRR